LRIENRKWRIIIFFILIFFIGCAEKTTPIFMTFHSKKIKFSDQGFLKEGFGYKEIIIYKDGIKPIKFIIKNSYVCFQDQCLDKQRFVKEFIGDYNVNFFDKILDREVLGFGKIKKIKTGFIEKDNSKFYLVTKDKVLFKDKKNHLIVLIKFLKDNN